MPCVCSQSMYVGYTNSVCVNDGCCSPKCPLFPLQMGLAVTHMTFSIIPTEHPKDSNPALEVCVYTCICVWCGLDGGCMCVCKSLSVCMYMCVHVCGAFSYLIHTVVLSLPPLPSLLSFTPSLSPLPCPFPLPSPLSPLPSPSLSPPSSLPLSPPFPHPSPLPSPHSSSPPLCVHTLTMIQ